MSAKVVTNHDFLIRAMVRAALAGNPSNPKAALTSIITGHYTDTLTDGRLLIRTAEAGGECQFQMPAGASPLDIMALAEEAIQWIDMQPDPTNINLKTRAIKRLRVSFRSKNFASPGNTLPSVPANTL